MASTVHTRSLARRRLAIESAAFGLGYCGVLVWGGSALVASFSAGEANPYWPALPYLRTDTSGVIGFAVAIVTLVLSRYLQLRRRTELRRSGAASPPPPDRPAGVSAVQAVTETAAVLATLLVIYLSVNALTHPFTLSLQLTHLAPWPTEGTVRVVSLAICLVAVATSRYLRASAALPVPAAAAEDKTSVSA